MDMKLSGHGIPDSFLIKLFLLRGHEIYLSYLIKHFPLREHKIYQSFSIKLFSVTGHEICASFLLQHFPLRVHEVCCNFLIKLFPLRGFNMFSHSRILSFQLGGHKSFQTFLIKVLCRELWQNLLLKLLHYVDLKFFTVHLGQPQVSLELLYVLIKTSEVLLVFYKLIYSRFTKLVECFNPKNEQLFKGSNKILKIGIEFIQSKH